MREGSDTSKNFYGIGYAEFRVILGTKNLRGDSLSAQASNRKRKLVFFFGLTFVRPFSSRLREKNQNDLPLALSASGGAGGEFIPRSFVTETLSIFSYAKS